MDLAFELMGMGLAGVFTALLILFFSVMIMIKIFPQRKKKDPDSE